MFRFLLVTLTFASTTALAGGGGNSLPQLDVSTFPSQIFWLLITFGVLNFLISKSALPIIHEVMERRHHRIERDLEQAERLAIEAKVTRESYERLHSESLAQAKNLIARVALEIEAKQAVENSKLDSQIVSLMHRGEQQIAEKCAKMQEGLGELSGELAQAIILELSGKNADEALLGKYLVREE
jgi:F-type H+-transporting ATPase subunit b